MMPISMGMIHAKTFLMVRLLYGFNMHSLQDVHIFGTNEAKTHWSEILEKVEAVVKITLTRAP